LLKLGIEDCKFIQRDLPFFKNGKSAVLKIQDAEVGSLGQVSDELIDAWGIKKREIFICELNIEKIFNFKNLKKICKPLVNFPSVKRDISLIVDVELPAERIINIIKEEGSLYLKNIVLLEQYTGKQIPVGSKGLSFSLEYQAPDKTLKDEEVNIFHNNICQTLKDKLRVEIR